MSLARKFFNNAVAPAVLVFGLPAGVANAGGLEPGKCYPKNQAESVLKAEGEFPIIIGNRVTDDRNVNIFFMNDLGYGYNIEGMRYPRLTYRITGPALPWLQLGDMVTIDASEPVTADRTAIVTGLAFSWQPDQPWLMTVEAVDYAGLFEHAGNYHIVGTDNYGAKVSFV